jgi:hypothetical protein
MMKENYMAELVPFGKTAIRPKRVQYAFLHNVTSDELVAGYEHKVLGVNSSMVVHARTLIEDGVG